MNFGTATSADNNDDDDSEYLILSFEQMTEIHSIIETVRWLWSF